MRPASPCFIACDRPFSEGRIIVYGIPFEGRVNLRKGADGGPRDLRLASDSIETYSPWAERDLEDLPLADIGDCELPEGVSPREQLDAARKEIAAWWRPGLIPFMLGGDHTATVPVIEALAPSFPELRILQLDAHPDTREEFLGERYNYASAMARVMDVVAPERVFQIGMRTGSREEYLNRRPNFFPVLAGHPVDVVRSLLPRLRSAPALRDDRRGRARSQRGAGHRLARARRPARARAARDRPHAERLPDHRRRPGRGRARLGPERPHGHRGLLGDPRGDAHLVGRPCE